MQQKIKKKKYPKIQSAKITILSRVKNTIFTLATMEGNKLFGCSPACYGFKNTKKSAPIAIKTALSKLIHTALELFQIKNLHIVLHGPGPFGSDILYQITNQNLPIKSIVVKSNLPHGGCKMPRPRRV